MKKTVIQGVVLLFTLTYSKVVVIDDLGVTKRFPLEGKPLIEKVREKIKSGDEEVVIYGKSPTNRDIKISSKDVDRTELLKKAKAMKRKIEESNNERILNSLKKLVGVPKPPFITRLKKRGALKDNHREKTRVFNMKELDSNNIDIDEPVIEKSKLGDINSLPENNLTNFSFRSNRTPNKTNLSPHKDYEETYDSVPSYEQDSTNNNDYLQSPYQDRLPDNQFSPDIYQPGPSPYNPKIDNFPLQPPDYPDTTNPLLRDNISLLKTQEKENLTRAIQNRKEYLRIKIDEVHGNKEKIAQEVGDYKAKVEDLVNRIKSARTTRENMITRMNMQQNHIENLKQNSESIKEKEHKLKSLIKHTKNEILKYKSLLENENSKMEVLQKQFEVYENTLKKYDNESNQEGINLSKYSNILARYENDLKDLNDMFTIYNNKLNELNDHLKKQTKLESDLDIEARKLDRANLNTFV